MLRIDIAMSFTGREIKAIVLLLSFFVFARIVFAQQISNVEYRPMIRGAIMMANTHVPNATEGDEEIAIVPVWGFDFDYIYIVHAGPLRYKGT